MPAFSERETRSFYNFLVSLEIHLESNQENASQEDIRALADTRRALKKLESGDFGICESCGDDLPYGRLKMHPEKLFCMDCEPASEMEMELS